MQTKPTLIPTIAFAAFVALALPPASRAVDAAPTTSGAPVTSAEWKKPAWLSDLSVGIKEGYEDNVMGVSGLGMPEQSSWVTDVALKFGVNFVPLLGDQHAVQTLSLIYQPDFFTYSGISQENYDAHRLIGTIKGKADNVLFSLENSFLNIDGNKVAPIYALNQIAGAAGNQNDKFRNNYAHGPARERREQIQDRYTAFLQFNVGDYFVRPISTLTYYDLKTDLHNTTPAPYKGYQNYADRYDVNVGVDFGRKITPNLWATLGYRYGYQDQQQFAPSITADRHYTSGYYQRALLGLEGKLGKNMTMKLAAGPDFRDYDEHTPINNLHTTRYYAEATVSVLLAPDQTLNLNYKKWMFVASTGIAPYVDTTATLGYHWTVNKQWGLDLGARFLEANYTMGNDYLGTAPSLRDDLDYGVSMGLTYAITPHFGANFTYAYDKGKNGYHNLPANLFPEYREFDHNLVTFGLQYKF
jgi:hypothetical protein